MTVTRQDATTKVSLVGASNVFPLTNFSPSFPTDLLRADEFTSPRQKGERQAKENHRPRYGSSSRQQERRGS